MGQGRETRAQLCRTDWQSVPAEVAESGPLQDQLPNRPHQFDRLRPKGSGSGSRIGLK